MGYNSMKGDAPVFPEVGSMTTLCPGISFPSCSATSIMRFAILSFTEPPGEVHSNFPTERKCCCPHALVTPALYLTKLQQLTEIALETFLLCNPVEANEGSIPDCVEDRFEYE
jgi:hypothetical protein